MSISIVIPAYNEENRIGLTLDRILLYISGNSDVVEVLVVLNNCTDDTYGVVNKYKLLDKRIKIIDCGFVLGKNLGNTKGYAVKVGLMNSVGEYVLFMDADNSTDIYQLDKFLPLLGKYDCIIGSRYLSDSLIVNYQSIYRIIISRISNILIRILFLPKIKDTQCGFKIFSKKSILKTSKHLSMSGFSFDVEILFLIKKLGFKIKEVGITWDNKKDSKIRFNHLWAFSKDLLVLFFKNKIITSILLEITFQSPTISFILVSFPLLYDIINTYYYNHVSSFLNENTKQENNQKQLA